MEYDKSRKRVSRKRENGSREKTEGENGWSRRISLVKTGRVVGENGSA
jgi:hypothetical protein